ALPCVFSTDTRVGMRPAKAYQTLAGVSGRRLLGPSSSDSGRWIIVRRSAISKLTTRACFGVFVLGSILPALATEGLAQRLTQASTPEGLRLLHKLQDALGGAKRIAGIRDFEETIRAGARDASGGALGEVRKRTRWIRNANVIRLDQR